MSLEATRQDLLRQFRNQQEFSVDYSPLYAFLFGTVAGWLEHNGSDPLVIWLVETLTGRPAFDSTLLMMAGLHRLVLAGEPSAADLATAYATVGGSFPTSPAGQAMLENALYETVMANQPVLGTFLREGQVQTNETARGLVWLLPAAWAGWREMHLIELGASAGLNLVAEQRGYVLAPQPPSAGPTLYLGSGGPQFHTLYSGDAAWLVGRRPPMPYIVSRTGGDQTPFALETAAEELALASFVWGDQPERMVSLWAAIEAYRQTAETAPPVRVRPVMLPDDLTLFLEAVVPSNSTVPVLIYNTTISIYFPDRGRALRDKMAIWAAQQSHPILWAQWEQSLDLSAQPPQAGWLRWTLDLWEQGRHHHWPIAWIHPHGGAMRWEPGAANWRTDWKI